ncbi:MAG TPA: hypothetical protein VKX33_04090 [Cyclobacteriaceae bacterium]|nr:hypothetical protein [Cyclobacteriaceae bacterium]
MKKIIRVFSLLGFIALISCETNTVKNIDDNAMMDRRDTSAIKEEFNSRGVPAEGIPDNNAVRADTIGVGTGGNIDNSQVMGSLPQGIADKIMNDETLRKKRLSGSREFSEGGTTYYELTFENGERTTVTFDQQGNRRNQ